MIRPGRLDGDDNEVTAFCVSLGAKVEDRVEGRILIDTAYDTLAAEADP